jgi:hypothetical protein
MKIRTVKHNNHRKTFDVRVGRSTMPFPYAKADPSPSAADPVAFVAVDEEIDREGFTYTLCSGREGTVHLEQVREYNQEPSYLRDRLLYELTLEAQRRLAKSPLSKREIVRRLRTSATQLYRLLDQRNYDKSMDQLVALLQVLDCEVHLVIRKRMA